MELLGISGSTRPDSTNAGLLQALGATRPGGLDLRIFDPLDALPHFDPTPGARAPAPVRRFLDAVAQARAVVVSSPEYVFSPPAVLKNALEWSVATEVFAGKLTAVIVAAAAGDETLASLRRILETLGARVPERLTWIVSGARGKLSDGRILDDPTRRELARLSAALAEELQSR